MPRDLAVALALAKAEGAITRARRLLDHLPLCAAVEAQSAAAAAIEAAKLMQQSTPQS